MLLLQLLLQSYTELYFWCRFCWGLWGGSVPSIYSTPTGFVIALLLKAWWTESLTVQIISLLQEKRASCCDAPGVPSSPGTALLLWVPPAAAAPGSFHFYSASQGFAVTCFHHAAMSLQQCGVTAVGSDSSPKAALSHILQSHCFLDRQNSRLSHLLPVHPDSHACLHHTLLHNPVSTTIHDTPLTQCTNLNTDRNRNLARILILCVPGSFFLKVQWPSRKMRVSGACQEACGLGKLYPSLHGCSVTRLQFHQWHHSQGAHFKPWPFPF